MLREESGVSAMNGHSVKGEGSTDEADSRASFSKSEELRVTMRVPAANFLHALPARVLTPKSPLAPASDRVAIASAVMSTWTPTAMADASRLAVAFGVPWRALVTTSKSYRLSSQSGASSVRISTTFERLMRSIS